MPNSPQALLGHKSRKNTAVFLLKILKNDWRDSIGDNYNTQNTCCIGGYTKYSGILDKESAISVSENWRRFMVVFSRSSGKFQGEEQEYS